MENQGNTQWQGVKKRANAIWKAAERLAPYAGIVSVAFGFLYWIFNDGVTKRMEDRHRTLAQLTNERWMYEALSRILQQGGNISKAQIRGAQTREDLGEQRSSQALREFTYLTDRIAFAQEFQSDLADLVQYAWRVSDLSEQITHSRSDRDRVNKLASDAELLSDSVAKANSEYRALFRKVFGADSVSTNSITPDQVHAISPAVDAYDQAARSAAGRYLDVQNGLNHLSAELYSIAKSDAERASTIAAFTTPIGYLVYTLAALIALLGKWTELKSGRAPASETGAP
jgi:hypothetical protein